MEKISIIVPCYNEELVLPIFYKEIKEIIKVMKKVSFELLFVDDGSKDKTLDILKEFSKNDLNVRYISFSRNFGKEAAMYAGLKESSGDYVAIMDADLQDPPALLSEMYRLVKEEGYDCAATRRVTRAGEPPIRSFFARLFYKIINRISKADIVDGARDYRLMTRQMVNAVLSMEEYNRFSKGIFGWIGFKTKWIEFENIERAAGETKWSFFKLFLYSIEGIVAFSTFPLVFPILFGIIFIIITVLLLLIGLIKSSSLILIVASLFFVSAVCLISLGIIAQYLSKKYSEVKKRQVYIIRETERKKKLV